MSLVHDALEKAKREASAQSAREMGLPETRVGAGQPFRARRAGHSPAALAAAAALGVALTVLAVRWFGASKPTAETRPAPAPATSAAAPASAQPETTPPPALASAAPTSTPTSAPAATPIVSPSTPTAQAPPAPAPPRSPVAPSSPPAPRADAPAPRPAAPAATSSEFEPSFRRQVTLDDGTVIKLGGIAWSEEAPLAYLNDKLYVKGERVGGFRVERIERERVLLVAADGRRLYLTLR